MSNIEPELYHLHDKLKSVLGPIDADTLMKHLSPRDWSELADKRDLEALQLATKYDLGELRHEMTAEFASVRGEIATVRGEMATEFAAVRGEMTAEFASVRGEIATVRGEMTSEFAAVRGEMATGFADVRGEMATGFAAVRTEMAGMTRSFVTLLILSQAGVIAAVTMVAAFLN